MGTFFHVPVPQSMGVYSRHGLPSCREVFYLNVVFDLTTSILCYKKIPGIIRKGACFPVPLANIPLSVSSVQRGSWQGQKTEAWKADRGDSHENQASQNPACKDTRSLVAPRRVCGPLSSHSICVITLNPHASIPGSEHTNSRDIHMSSTVRYPTTVGPQYFKRDEAYAKDLKLLIWRRYSSLKSKWLNPLSKSRRYKDCVQLNKYIKEI